MSHDRQHAALADANRQLKNFSSLSPTFLCPRRNFMSKRLPGYFRRKFGTYLGSNLNTQVKNVHKS